MHYVGRVSYSGSCLPSLWCSCYECGIIVSINRNNMTPPTAPTPTPSTLLQLPASQEIGNERQSRCWLKERDLHTDPASTATERNQLSISRAIHMRLQENMCASNGKRKGDGDQHCTRCDKRLVRHAKPPPESVSPTMCPASRMVKNEKSCAVPTTL